MDLTGQPPSNQPPPRRDADAALVDKVCAWIDLHLDENIDWDRLVRISGVPVSRLQQMFTRYRRTTPMMYIRQRRLDRGSPQPTQDDLPAPPAFLSAGSQPDSDVR